LGSTPLILKENKGTKGRRKKGNKEEGKEGKKDGRMEEIFKA
jgi:hypothetical protein